MQNGGLRTKGITKSSQAGKPLISVVTVVYNGAAALEQTIQSVVGQTYDNVEYIIIDGASTDGTLDIIKKYEDKIDWWQSEPDKGIYDAMNKGVMLATGEWINFMNAGDSFVGASTLFTCFVNKSYLGVDIIYGDSIQLNEDTKRICLSDDNSDLLYRRPCYRHGASFVRAEVHKTNLFDLSRKDLGYALDYNLIYNLKCSGYIFKRIPIAVLNYEKDGVSNNILQGAKYIYRITKNRNPIKSTLYFFVRNIKYYLKLYR